MKSIIRKRTEVAECRLVVAKHAEREAQKIRDAAYRARRALNLDEYVRIRDLKALANKYRDEACRHILIAAGCGNAMLDIKPL